MVSCKKKFFSCIIFTFYFFLLKSQVLPKPSKDPKKQSIKEHIYYDSEKKLYILEKKEGDISLSPPVYLNKTQYLNYLFKKKTTKNPNKPTKNKPAKEIKKQKPIKKKGKIFPDVEIKSKVLKNFLGGDKIEFIPMGQLSLSLGLSDQKINSLSSSLGTKKRSSLGLDLDPQIEMGILGKLGNKLEVSFKFDKENPMSFEENLKLKFKGDQEDIIKKIELGKINFPLTNSLIGSTEGLFGIKGKFQFGNTFIDAIASQKKSKSRTIHYNKKEALQNFEKSILDYQENQHYFLAHYFRNTYDKALEHYEYFSPSILIEKIELWTIDNGSSETQNKRSLLALRELGEANEFNLKLPDNYQNEIYNLISQKKLTHSYEISNFLENKKIEETTYKNQEHFFSLNNASLLNLDSDYTFQKNLGYISLRRPLREDQMLAVAFSYRNLKTGKSYQIGEFTSQKNDSSPLLVKLLKSRNTKIESPMWKLMMKNIYEIGNKLKEDQFELNILYNETGKEYVPYLKKAEKKIPLLFLLHLDRLDEGKQFQKNDKSNLQAFGDRKFDYLEGITIDSENGNLIFTKVEPFGEIPGLNEEKYLFKELYIKKKASLLGYFDKKKLYKIKGRYLSNSYLGNIELSSMKVHIEGKLLNQNTDYIVKDNGEIEIINPALKNKPYSLSYEEKEDYISEISSFLGLHIDHYFSENLKLGFTALHFSQNPNSKKIFYGSELLTNKIFGLDLHYKQNLSFLDSFLNKIKIQSSSPSYFKTTLEGAYLSSKPKVDLKTYLDDFDEKDISISLHTQIDKWYLASFPERNNPDFNPLENFYSRGLLSWYTISPFFYDEPKFISKETLSKNLSRKIKRKEFFSTKNSNYYYSNSSEYLEDMQTFDLSFFPNEKGPYNIPKEGNTSKIWAGIMKSLPIYDFTSAGIEYLEFWLMDPFADNLGSPGELIFHLGDLSEDILKDGYLSYENGLSTKEESKETIENKWGKIPREDPKNYLFQTKKIKEQDLGLDGLDDRQEIKIYGGGSTDFINPITNEKDPARDNYVDFLDPRWDSKEVSIVERYKYYRNPQGNSSSPKSKIFSVDKEDIDEDLNLNTIENYYQYKIKISQNGIEPLHLENFLVEEKKTQPDLPLDIEKKETKWYKIRIPLKKGEAFGEIKDLSYIKHIRILMKGFSKTTILRFASLELKGSKWKKYEENLDSNDLEIPYKEKNKTSLTLDKVSLKDSTESNLAYVVPSGSTSKESNEEASLLLKIQNLGGKDLGNQKTVAIFREFKADFKDYKKIQLNIRCENLEDPDEDSLDKDLLVFLRLGGDKFNYYQYEMPLKYTSLSGFSQNEIWPKENLLEIDLKELIKAKLQRNQSHFDQKKIFEYQSETNQGKILVRGSPSIGQISNLILGIKNKDLTKSKNVLIWLDDLSLVGIENQKTYAYNAQIDFYLADLMQIDLSGKYLQSGFRAIYQKKMEASPDDLKNYNLSTKIFLQKFFPKKWALKIPFHYELSENFVFSKYDHQEEDLKPTQINLHENWKKTNLENKKISNYYVSFSKDKSNKKPKIWHVENFSLDLSYQKKEIKNFYYDHFLEKKLQTHFAYQYNLNPKFYSPFGKENFSDNNNKWKTWIKNFRINFYPTKIWINHYLDRLYNQYNYKINQSFPSFDRAIFNFNWDSGFSIEILPDLEVEFFLQAKNKLKKDFKTQNKIWKNILNRGRPLHYRQHLNISYPIAINKIPYLDFISKSYFSYKSFYLWKKNPFQQKGDAIENKQEINWDFNFELEKIYNHFPAFLRIKEKLKRENLEIKKWLYSKSKKRKSLSLSFTESNKLSAREHFLLALMGLKKIKFSYLNSTQTALDGLLPLPIVSAKNSEDWSLPHFSFGGQKNIRKIIAQENNFVSNDYLSDFYYQNHKKEHELKVELNPLKDLKIKLNTYKKIDRKKYQVNFALSLVEKYDLQMSSISFIKKKKIYEKISFLKKKIKNSPFPIEWAFPSIFFSSTGPQNFKNFKPDYLALFALPNWEITYNGLAKNKNLLRYIEKFEIHHNYQCFYNFRQMQNDFGYKKIELFRGFQPLIGIKIKLRNQIEFTSRYQDYEKFSLHPMLHSTQQKAQKEWILGLGYTLKNLIFKIRFRNKKRKIKGNIHFRFQLGIHHEDKKNYKILEEKIVLENKEKNYSFGGSISYFFNQNFRIKAFMEYLKRNQKLVLSPKFEKLSGGIQFSFKF